MVETLQKLKAKGHSVTDEEIFEAETEMLEMIRSRKKFQPSGELPVKVPNAVSHSVMDVDDEDDVPSSSAEELRASAIHGSDSNKSTGTNLMVNFDDSSSDYLADSALYEA